MCPKEVKNTGEKPPLEPGFDMQVEHGSIEVREHQPVTWSTRVRSWLARFTYTLIPRAYRRILSIRSRGRRR